MVADGDLAAGRSFEGPTTMVVSAHDTGGPTSDLNARRMAIRLDGTLATPDKGPSARYEPGRDELP